MQDKQYTCIYHAKCPDGFAAAWVVFRALGPQVEFIPAKYGDTLPEITGKHVIIVDFSYSAGVMDAALKQAASLLVLDHHASAEKNLEHLIFKGDWPSARDEWDDVKGKGGGVCLFDMSRSGAQMTWDFFFPDVDTPKLISYVQDRDLWQHKLEKTKAINEWIMSFEQSLMTFDFLDITLEDPDGFEEAVACGESIRRSKDHIIAMTIEDGLKMMKIGGIDMPVVNVPHVLASDTADMLKSNHPVAATYVDIPEGRRFSIRARSDNEIDVTDIVGPYGGGGHKKAGGVTMPHGWMGEE